MSPQSNSSPITGHIPIRKDEIPAMASDDSLKTVHVDKVIVSIIEVIIDEEKDARFDP